MGVGGRAVGESGNRELSVQCTKEQIATRLLSQVSEGWNYP